MAKAEKKQQEYVTYKGKPLIRRGNLLYYGDKDDKFYILFTVNGSEDVYGMDIANSVTVELRENTPQARVIKTAERTGLYTAMDIGQYWLEDALENA